MFVFQSVHTLMSWRDKVRWDGGWTFRGSPGWGRSTGIMCVVTERRFVRGDKWSMFDGGTGGSWTVMNSGISQLKSSTSFLYYDSCLTWVIPSCRNHPLMMYCGVFELLLFRTWIDILLGPITKWTPLVFSYFPINMFIIRLCLMTLSESGINVCADELCSCIW